MADVHPYFKGMVYGPSGVGKTVLALEIAQAITPPDQFIIYLDSMENWVSIQNHPELKNRVKRFKYEGLSQIDAMRDAIKDKFDIFGNVGCFIFDELDAMQGNDLDIVAAASKEDGHGPDDVTWPDFNKNTVRVRRTMREFLKLDINVMMVAHDGEGKDRRGVKIQRPDFTPKLAKAINEFIHLCGYMTAEVQTAGDGNQYTRRVQVHPTGNLVTKSRVGGLPVKVSSQQLITGIIEWRKGEREDVLVESTPVEVESDDPAIVVED
jgi:hypothetical protein